MAIVNRRNAVLGWVVWEAGKRVAKKKAKEALPGSSPAPSAKKRVPVVLGALGAAAGAIWFWFSRGDGDKS